MEGFIRSLKTLFIRFSPSIPLKIAWILVNSEGRLYDYYIPRRARVKGGILFGFFRFKNVEVSRRVILSLDKCSRAGVGLQVE